eukprot:scaffold16085_cov127-Skeletonema_marinoi.AAC.8
MTLQTSRWDSFPHHVKEQLSKKPHTPRLLFFARSSTSTSIPADQQATDRSTTDTNDKASD